MDDERDYEAEAQEQGWVDKDAWKGDPEKHTDAKTFVERGEKIAGILKSRLDKQDSQIKSLQESNRKFGEYHKQTLAKTEQDNATRVAALEAELEQAVTDGDGLAFSKANREINDLRENYAPTDDANAWNQMVQAWAGQNEWYSTNPKLATYADGLSDQLRNEGYNGQAYFSELTRRVKADNPEEFKNPNRDRPNGVDVGGSQVSESKAKTYDALDAEAKRACDGFVADGFMTQDEYVKQYEFED